MRRFNLIELVGTGIFIGIITYLFEDLDDDFFDRRDNQYNQYNNNNIIISNLQLCTSMYKYNYNNYYGNTYS